MEGKHVLRGEVYLDAHGRTMTYEERLTLVIGQTRLELPLYSGRVLFLKQRGVIISLIMFFQPRKRVLKASGTIAPSYRTIHNRKLRHVLAYQKQASLYNSLFTKPYTF